MGLNSDSVVNVIDLELYTQILTDCHSMAKVVNVLVRFFFHDQKIVLQG